MDERNRPGLPLPTPEGSAPRVEPPGLSLPEPPQTPRQAPPPSPRPTSGGREPYYMIETPDGFLARVSMSKLGAWQEEQKNQRPLNKFELRVKDKLVSMLSRR